MPGYDQESDMKLKNIGNNLHDALMELYGRLHNGSLDWGAERYANQIATETFGFLPRGDGPNTLSDEDVRNAIPKAATALCLVRAILKAE